MCTSIRLVTFLASTVLVVFPMLGWAQVTLSIETKKQKPPPDEFKAIINVIEDAYKAPFEVDKDILDELRKQYRDPKPDREDKIFREIRRLYATTVEQEEAILAELRRAYADPSPQQEERLFHVIRRNGQLPLGSISQQTQVELAGKLFRKLDRNENGIIDSDEMSDSLAGQRREWDQNRDGVIAPEEYVAYYRAHLGSVYQRVASGEIQIKLPKELASQYPVTPTTSISPSESRRPTEQKPVAPSAEVPRWFAEYDLDGDGQVALFEWKKVGQPIAEFLAMDSNDDGFLEATELTQYLAANSDSKSDSKSKR